MTDVERRTDLAAFLRSRRAGLTPGDVGLPNGGRRRTPGLRREEVAALADVGVTWYTFLEQGRRIKMSAEALQRVADALRLPPQEVTHLFLLAERIPPSPPPAEAVPDAVSTFIAGLEESPAWLVTPGYDVRAWNRAAAAAWVDLATVRPGDRNLLWLMLTDPRARTTHVDWEGNARSMLTAFRGRLAENQNDPDLAGLADRLHAASAEFREWWPRQDVVYQLSLALETRHREVGVLRFTATTLRPEAAPLLRLLIWTPDPETRARLRKLLAD